MFKVPVTVEGESRGAEALDQGAEVERRRSSSRRTLPITGSTRVREALAVERDRAGREAPRPGRGGGRDRRGRSR